MAKIKHIAICTPDPEKTAAFYKDVFGLKEVGQARTGCYLSDGHINLAILKSRDEGGDESPRDAVGSAASITSASWSTTPRRPTRSSRPPGPSR